MWSSLIYKMGFGEIGERGVKERRWRGR